MAELIRARDWAATPLGPLESWPQGLRTAVRLMLATRHPVFLFWGPDLRCLYNDAYAAYLGPEMHPAILGAPGPDAWAGSWSVLGPEVEKVRAGGEAAWHEDRPVPIVRRGRREDAWWTYSLSPIDDEASPSGVGGVLAFLADTTERVLARRRAEERSRESEARLRFVSDAAELGTWDLDLTTDRSAVRSLRHDMMFGYAESQPEWGQAIAERHVVEEDRPAFRKAFARARETGVLACEVRVRWPDGSVHWIAPLGRTYRDEAGRPVHMAGVVADITEQKRAEAALRESEARFRILADAIQDVFYITDLDRNELLYLSPGYERVWGRPAAELRADLSAFLGTLHPDDRAHFVAGKEAQARGESVAVEYRIARPDGEVRWIYDRSFPAPDAPGRCAAGVASDMTARKEAEASLRASEERFRHVVRATRDIVWDIDLVADRVWWSEALRTELGFAPEDIGPDTAWCFAHMHPEDRERVARGMKEAVAGAGDFWSDEFRYRRADGSHAHMAGRGFIIRGARGEALRMIGAMQDVTERRRAETALRESEARFRHMADSAPALIWMTDADGRLVFANMHHDYVFGRPAAEILEDGWAKILLPEDLGPFKAAFRDAFEARRPFKAEARVRDKAGRVRWLRCEGVPRLDDAGAFLGYTGCNLDITEARLAAEELERRVAVRTAELMAAEETLRQAQKMEAVGQLTGGIAHDFNNMLQGVAGGLDMARRRIAQGRAGDAGRYLDAARAAVDRAAGLTRRLLAFARRQRLEPRPVDAGRLVAGMADLVRRTVGIGVVLELRSRGGAWSVLCDANELESALLNLCINARDAMPAGGRLLIGTEGVRLSPADVAGQEGVAPGDYVAISVSDTGTGIPPEVLDRVFEPFFTTKPVGQGTGLGLSQIYGFARQSGGFVRLESEVGRGTTVTLLLPRHRPAEAAAPRVERPAASKPAGAGATVLLVDDEAAVRGPAAERLRELGHSVLEAADGPAALRLLGEGARIDLLVTDVGLPRGMNGRQVAEAVRERAPGVPVLFITGYAANTRLPPGTEVIGKPFELDAVARRVQALLAAADRGGPQAAERPAGPPPFARQGAEDA